MRMPNKQSNHVMLSSLLHKIIAHWPRERWHNRDPSLGPLAKYLADDFETADLRHQIDSVAEIDSIEVGEQVSHVYFDSESFGPYRAVFVN